MLWTNNCSKILHSAVDSPITQQTDTSRTPTCIILSSYNSLILFLVIKITILQNCSTLLYCIYGLWNMYNVHVCSQKKHNFTPSSLQVKDLKSVQATWLSHLPPPAHSSQPFQSPSPSLHLPSLHQVWALHWRLNQNWALFSSWAHEATSGAPPQKFEVSSTCAPLLQSARPSAPPDLPPPPPSGACPSISVKITATSWNYVDSIDI